MDQYAKNFNRIADCVERRAFALHRQPMITDIASQLAIRGRVFRASTVMAEISSARSILNAAIISEGKIMLKDGVHERDWILNAGEESLANTRKILSQTMQEILDMGEVIIAEDLNSMHGGEAVGRNEAIDILAGRVRDDVNRVDQKSQRYITWRDMRSIELEISGHDPMESITSLEEGKPANIEGLLRVFMSVMWFTGMRPVEIWNSVLMVPCRDIPFTPAMIEMACKKPELALLEDWFTPVHKAAELSGETNFGLAAKNASIETGAPCILMIRSAKQTNANAAKTPIRLQILKGIPAQQLNLIAAASVARLFQISEKRQDSIRSSMGRVLAKITSRDPVLRDMKINLYTFRHSFASRVKLYYEPHEAAALTGHTSVMSLYRYGQRKLHSGTTRRRKDDWLPAPDPERAEQLRIHWVGKEKKLALEPGMQGN